jgi:hypothetical protein
VGLGPALAGPAIRYLEGQGLDFALEGGGWTEYLGGRGLRNWNGGSRILYLEERGLEALPQRKGIEFLHGRTGDLGWTLYLAGRGLDSIPGRAMTRLYLEAGGWTLYLAGRGLDSIPGLRGGWTLYLDWRGWTLYLKRGGGVRLDSVPGRTGLDYVSEGGGGVRLDSVPGRAGGGVGQL